MILPNDFELEIFAHAHFCNKNAESSLHALEIANLTSTKITSRYKIDSNNFIQSIQYTVIPQLVADLK